MAHVLYRIESHYVSVHSLCYLALDAVEGAAADEEYIACIYVDIVLVGMHLIAVEAHCHVSPVIIVIIVVVKVNRLPLALMP